MWNSFVAAWFEGGKDDPKLQLVRLDPERAQVWLNENSLWAAVKLLLGRDPKKDYKDKVADVRSGSALTHSCNTAGEHRGSSQEEPA